MGVRLTRDDPYVVIDLDKTDSTEQKANARHIYESFDSYSESSYSKKGVHIILKGPNEEGRRKGNVEIYSQDRYIICTGNILRNLPIKEGGEALVNLRASLNKSENPDALPIINNDDEKETDDQIIKRMFGAKNGDEVRDLYETVPSSTDDWSLLDSKLAQHICFYTKNQQQALRLFRGSALYRGFGSEKKKSGYERADKYEEDYLIRRTFARAWHLINQREAQEALKRRNTDQMIQNSLDVLRAKQADINEETIKEKLEYVVSSQVTEDKSFKVIIDPATGEVITIDTSKKYKSALSEIKKPTGLVGEIADYIMKAAPRPMYEAAIAGALTFVAGLSGRHYNISGTGLGLYTVLLADTGRGKESASSGIANLSYEVSKITPIIDDFRGPSSIASGQGLIRVLAEENVIPSKFMFMSEFGHLMRVITAKDATGPEVKTRQVLLDLYSKSAWGSTLNESAYADKANNTKVVRSPNISLMGDTTPTMLFEYMNDSMLSEGFVPRFLFIEYDGPRVAPNPDINKIPPDDLVNKCVTLIHNVMRLKEIDQCMNILVNDKAKAILDNFNDYCDAIMNGQIKDANAVDFSLRELWNRAHLMVLRISGILAVGNNQFSPCVTEEDAQWAVDLVLRSLNTVKIRHSRGLLGVADESIRQTVKSIIADYFKNNHAGKLAKRLKGRWAKYEELQAIPLKYLVMSTEKFPSFKNNAAGHTRVLHTALTSFVQQGDLIEYDMRVTTELDKRFKGLETCYTLGATFWDSKEDIINEDD
jgi:hypothetical protein